MEIIATPTVVTEHQGLAYWCDHCQKLHVASLPDAVRKAGLFGPRLTALVAFMKGVCHASFSTIRKFLRDVVGVPVSRGYLAKLIAKVSESLAQSYAELFERLSGEATLNIDETGHKENGERFWTWCFFAPALWPAAAGRAAGVVCRDPPPRDDDRGGLSAGIGSGPPASVAGGHERCARHEVRSKHRQTIPRERRSLFPLHHHARHRPANDLAEQAMRFVVIDRHITQGTRSEGGRRWCERIWTVIATCAQRVAWSSSSSSTRFKLIFPALSPSLLPSGP